MAKTFTPAQLAAIRDNSREILVSAAAGSGKTTVLAERILKRITDTSADAPSLSDILVVTFTNAAAADLRKKIGEVLKNALTADPTNKKLQQQIYALPSAAICTIDSFYLRLVRENFEKLDVSANLKIIDENEAELLQKRLLNEVLDAYYDGVHTEIPDFPAFMQRFDSEDALFAILRDLFQTSRCFPEGIDFLKTEQAAGVAAADDFYASKYADMLWSNILDNLHFYAERIRIALPELLDNDDYKVYVYPQLESDLATLNRLLYFAEQKDILQFKTTFETYQPARAKAATGMAFPPKIAFLREQFRNQVKKFIRTELPSCALFAPPERLAEETRLCADTIGGLYAMLATFTEKYEAEKKKRGAVDFANLSELAYRLFYSDGTLTADAYRVSAKYKEIYIDEYQDVNLLQDKNFQALACHPETHRFMVGDIKQSIYGFRGADPSGFSAYRTQFPQFHPETDAPEPVAERTIFLSDNFRSDSGVIDTCNAIFFRLFQAVRSVPYLKEDNLHRGLDAVDKMLPATIVLAEKPRGTTENPELDFIVTKIKELLNNGVLPDQIVILLRSLAGSAFSKGNGAKVDAYLRAHGIPTDIKTADAFFENPEVLLFLSLLRTIDRPHADIPLAATLKSPLFGFTLADLAAIRAETRDGSLYRALQNYTAAHSDFTKGQYFLNALQNYRDYAKKHTVDKLIWYVWQDTAFLAMVGATADTYEAKLRHANLMLLYDHARKTEQVAFGGLHAFVRYIDQSIKNGANMENVAGLVKKSGAVRIMSIHTSKGLEFDYCFVAHMDGDLKITDPKATLLFSHELGTALKLRGFEGLTTYTPPQYEALTAGMVTENIAERIRLLYVALTRAKKQVFLTANYEKPLDLLSACEQLAPGLSAGLLAMRHSFMEWVLLALAGDCAENGRTLADYMQSDAFPFRILLYNPTASADTNDTSIVAATAENEDDTASSETIAALRTLFTERFSFTYPHTLPVDLPAKLSVSALHPGVLDADDAAATELVAQDEPLIALPQFMQASAEVSAAERGTATHVFMQFFDTESVLQNGVQKEAERLVAARFIPAEYKDLIRYDELERFFASDLFRKMQHARFVRRELRFNIPLSAADFTEQADVKAALAAEEILVQGVIDCLFEDENGKLWLVDYKTDRIAQGTSDAAARHILEKRHGTQLSYYKEAVRRIVGCAPDFVCIYAFALGRTLHLS